MTCFLNDEPALQDYGSSLRTPAASLNTSAADLVGSAYLDGYLPVRCEGVHLLGTILIGLYLVSLLLSSFALASNWDSKLAPSTFDSHSLASPPPPFRGSSFHPAPHESVELSDIEDAYWKDVPCPHSSGYICCIPES